MDTETAGWLTGPEGAAALRRAGAEADPASLAAGERLRRWLSPERAAAVSEQLMLRRRAAGKFGDRAGSLMLTRDGLEQASRPAVARWRAGRLRDAGARRVLDLGCGIAADSMAMAEAGLEVVAVEADPVTAAFAAANLGDRGRVIVGDAPQLFEELWRPSTAVFCDPARRTAAGRSWRLEDLSPPWSFVLQVLEGGPACVKLGPGLPHRAIPPGVSASWVSDAGDLVEASLWSGVDGEARAAVLLPGAQQLSGTAAGDLPVVDPRPGQVLYEPDPAVIRAGLVELLGVELDAGRPAGGIAYLLGKHPQATPFATRFSVEDVLDARERTLRAWVRSQDVGTLEIKKRGLEVDPAALRRRLKPAGRRSATLVLTPTRSGARALVVRRLDSGASAGPVDPA